MTLAMIPAMFLAMWNDHSMTEAMGRQAAVIAKEWWFFFAICGVAFVVTMLFLARALTKKREATDPQSASPAALDPRRERTLTIAVSAAMGVTVITLFVLLFVSVSTGGSIRHFGSKN